MALNLEQKKAVVEEVSAVVRQAHSIVGAEYRGLTVSELTKLRTAARKQNVVIKVVKNSLTRLATKGTEFECMNDQLTGPLILGFSMEDPGSAGRLFKDSAKEFAKLEVKLFAVGGEVHPGSEIDRLASLPTRDQAISLLMAVMKAPVEKFVRTLNEPHAKLVRTIAAVRDQKQAA